MSVPAVSVVVPTHNHSKFLPTSVGSVLDQTFRDFEIVIVDNGSTDDTADVVAGFDNPAIRYHYQEDSGLPGNSRNVGIKLARAGIVALLDSDDRWYPEKLAKSMAVLDSRPDVGLVCHNENVIRTGTPAQKSSYGPFVENMYESLLYGGNCLSTSAVVVRRSLLLQVGGFSERRDYVTVEDYDLWMKLARVCKFEFLGDVLGEYVLHDGNYSGNVARHYGALLNMIDAHFAALAAEDNLDERRALRRRTKILAATAREMLRSGNPAGAVAYAFKTAAGLFNWKRAIYPPNHAALR